MARQAPQKPVESDQNLPAIYQHVEENKASFALSLAGEVDVGKFVRSIHIAMRKDPKLQRCDPVSLVDACNKAANDGLLLDGQQAALVVFNSPNGPVAQYIPMFQGLMQRAYRSGLIDSWNVHLVYENELKVDPEIGRPRFQHIIDGVERITHMPIYSDPGKPALVYSAVKLRGSTSMNYCVMTIREVIDAAKSSRKNVDNQGNLIGLWAHPTHKIAMVKKTVIRRHAKYLPSDAHMASVVDHMDDADRLDEEPPQIDAPRPARKRTGEAAKRLTPTLEEEPFDNDTGEVIENEEEQPFTEELF